MALTVSKVASQVDVSPDTVRYYERVGLLAEPDRTTSGYRVYDDGVVDRLRFVKGAQRLGLRLDEIKELLDLRDRGLCPCGHADHLVANRLGELDEEIARLSTLRGELAKMLETRTAGGGCATEVFQIEGVRR